MRSRTRSWALVLAGLLISALSSSLLGQTGPTATPQQAPRTAPQTREVLPSYEGQHVTTVELAGQPELDMRPLQSLVAQKANQPFSQDKVNQTIRALTKLKRFQAVELEVRPEAKGVRVLFVLQPAVYFGIYEFPGAVQKYPYSRLLQVADYPPRGAYTPVDVRDAQDALTRFFQRAGYFENEVLPQVLVDRQNGLANVTFHVTLNRRAKFGNVHINGATPQETERLTSKLHSWIARLRSSAIIPGKTFNPTTLRNGTQYINKALMKEGFLGAEVNLVGAEYDPKTNRADISYNVRTGSKVEVKVEGARLWPWTKKKELPVFQQAGIDPEIIQEGRANLQSYFQSKGFFDANVRVTEQQQSGKDSIVYQITKGPRHKVAGVAIAGNDHISEDVLEKGITVEKGHFFSHGKYSDKLVHKSVKNLEAVYKAEGYSSVKIVPQVTNTAGNIRVTFRVNEGPQDVVEALRVEGNNTQPMANLLPGGPRLAPGQAYSQKHVDEDRNHILAKYLNLGYLNASFRETAATVNKDPHRLAVVYHITEGPQVHIANVVTLGRRVTRQTLVSRSISDLEPRRPLRESTLLSNESELYNAGIFDWAEIDPRRTITTQNQEDVLVKVHESKRNSITYGGGFEVINRGGSLPSGTVAVPGLAPVGLSKQFQTSEKTFYGPRGNFQYTRKNIRGKAETLTLSGLAGRLDQRGSVNFMDPHFRYTNWQSTFSLSGEHNSQNPIFTSRLAEAGWQLQRPLNPDKTTNLFVRYSFRETGITRLLIPDLIPSSDRHVRLSTVSSTLVRDTRDNILDAHKGLYQTVEFDLNPSALGSSVSFAKMLGQVAYYKKVKFNTIWANSMRVGTEQPFAGSHVPISEAFFSGGGSTLRGFPLNGAGPQRTIQACGTTGCFPMVVPVGGKQLAILNSEFRIPVPLDLPLVDKKLSIVPFYDGGNVFQHIGFHGQWTNTIGGGIRYETPVGPVRLDIGHNLNAPPGIKTTQIFVTLGQAF
ncbi:MAG: POTRA domain-containing protein [Terriglobales bacterium]